MYSLIITLSLLAEDMQEEDKLSHTSDSSLGHLKWLIQEPQCQPRSKLIFE